MNSLLVYSGDRQLTDAMSGRDRWKRHTLEELVAQARHQLDLISLGGASGITGVKLSAGAAALNDGLGTFERDHDTQEQAI
jgi:hypothetical protein